MYLLKLGLKESGIPKGKHLYLRLSSNNKVKSENVCLKFQFPVLYSLRPSAF